jgi:hypothetical protein
MTEYSVYLRGDIQWTMRKFEAASPQEAIELARRFAEERLDELDFEGYDYDPINDIEVCGDDGQRLAHWQDEDLRLRLAARDLLTAAEKVVARWKHGDLAGAVRELAAAIVKAKVGAG